MDSSSPVEAPRAAGSGRFRRTLPASVGLIGLGVAGTSAAIAFLAARAFSNPRAKGAAAKKKVVYRNGAPGSQQRPSTSSPPSNSSPSVTASKHVAPSISGPVVRAACTSGGQVGSPRARPRTSSSQLQGQMLAAGNTCLETPSLNATSVPVQSGRQVPVDATQGLLAKVPALDLEQAQVPGAVVLPGSGEADARVRSPALNSHPTATPAATVDTLRVSRPNGEPYLPDAPAASSSFAGELDGSRDSRTDAIEATLLPAVQAAESDATGVFLPEANQEANSSSGAGGRTHEQEEDQQQGQQLEMSPECNIVLRGRQESVSNNMRQEVVPDQPAQPNLSKPGVSGVLTAADVSDVEATEPRSQQPATAADQVAETPDQELIATALAIPDDCEDGEGITQGAASAVGGVAHKAVEEAVEAQSEVEAKAEQLLLTATTAWNVQGNRSQGVKMAKRALEALQEGPHRAKYRAEVASSLADMLYAVNQLDEALEAVGQAMQAAREAGEWALAVKLSNNMGAVFKKLGRISDAEALHRSCYSMAVSELGIAHPLALLARSNLTETLMLRTTGEMAGGPDGTAGGRAETQPGQRQTLDSEEDKAARHEARQLLKAALAQLELEAGEQRAALVGAGAVARKLEPAQAGTRERAAIGEGVTSVAESADKNGHSIEAETPDDALYRRTRTAIVRTYIELGRLEMVAGEDPDAAEGAYRAALTLCDELYGVDSRESSGPAFSLANCLRAIGKKEEARELYERLYGLIVKRNGQGEETAVHLARSLADLAEEAGDWTAVDKYASAALHSMTLLIGTRAHPVLESFYQAACRAKTQNGDAAGAEALRRQYLSGMLRLSQQQARGYPGTRAGPTGMPGTGMGQSAGGAAPGAPGGQKKGKSGGKKGRK